ncbi:HCP-like protein [Linnemannia elongata AG-77]|uniref:HCP-like protein n=1 Tax=Linnemannia elongata AG-77 TaxID=1314771 RepID=A0A197JN24_9FUNG|nr:HCP-like protein [Linnemannia elongata AG-77]
MTQGDDPQEQVQAMRSVNKGVSPNSIPPATLDEIYHVETLKDPDTQKEFIFWDDIVQAFDNAVQVRHKTRVVPFLRGTDHRILEPRRIAALPDVVLDVVVDNPVTDNVRAASPQVQQLALQLAPLQNGDEATSQDDFSASSAASTPITTTVASTPNATSSSSPPSTTTCTVRRNPVYGLVETAMENYTHIERPLAFPSARGPHTVLDDQTPAVMDLPVLSHPHSNNEAQQRAPQRSNTIIPMEKDVVRMSISASHGDRDAQVALGDMYRDGEGVAQDYQEAMDWYLKAAEQGDAAGQQRVGALYYQGFGVSQNYSTAMDWYLKAAEQGYAIAQHSIGILYNHGHGVLLNYGRAMDWYLEAADQVFGRITYRL